MIRFLLFTLLAAARPTGFDADRIVASFGIVSDVHIEKAEGEVADKFTAALRQLDERASEQDRDGLDALLVAGDLMNTPFKSEENYVQAEWFKSLYEKVFDPRDVPVIYTPGNHDVYKWWTPQTIEQAQHISDRLGPDYFRTDRDMDAKRNLECRHCVVKGVHILTIVPVGASPVVYTAGQKQWLDATLASVTKSDPKSYVLLLTHPMITGTVYGSMLGDYWATEDLTPILSKYPQVITFGGHLHFPLNDPRSIWQGDFTALGCGSVRYMAIEDGGYERMQSKTVMKDNREFSQGLLLQVDAAGYVRITRMDFHHKTTIGEPWMLDKPSKTRSHLKRYTVAAREKANSAPHLRDLSWELSDNGWSATFSSGTDDEFVHHYVLTVTNGGRTVLTKKILADFYRSPRPAGMKDTWTELLGFLPDGLNVLTLTAVDSWGAESSPLSVDIPVRSR